MSEMLAIGQDDNRESIEDMPGDIHETPNVWLVPGNRISLLVGELGQEDDQVTEEMGMMLENTLTTKERNENMLTIN